MGKSKKGPALFELWGKSGDREPSIGQVPKWWSSGRTPGEPAPRPTGHLTLVSSEHAGTHEGEPLFEVEGNRVRFSFTSLSAAVAIFLVLAVLTSVYVIASRSGTGAAYKRGFEAARSAEQPPPTDEIQLARNQPPATHLLTPLTGQSPVPIAANKGFKPEPTPVVRPQIAAAPPGIATKSWVQDLTYVVVQEFSASGLEKAKEAQKFLGDKGVDSAVVTLAGGGVHLITTQGYNHKDAAQKKAADQLLTKVRTIGQQYYAAGGGYKLEGYYKSLKKENW